MSGTNRTSRKPRGRGEGSIFQRDDGLWVGSISLGVDEKGKRNRKTVYGETKKEAQDKLDELREKARKGQPVRATTDMKVGAFLDLWLVKRKLAVGASTYVRYEHHVRLHIKPCLGNVKLAALTEDHVELLYERMREAGAPAGKQRRVGKALRQALRSVCGEKKLIHHNPAVNVPLPKATKADIAFYNPEQVGHFLKTVKPHRLYALFVVALDTGMRQGELFGLAWEDIDFDAGSVMVQHSLDEVRGVHRLKPPKSKAGRRRIELSKFSLDALHEHRKRMVKEGHAKAPVFCALRGGYLRKSNFRRKTFEPLIKKSKLPHIRFHDLRHTSATLLLRAGVHPKVVQERLGHADITLTLNTYSHVLPTMQQGAAKMDAFLGKSAEAPKKAEKKARHSV